MSRTIKHIIIHCTGGNQLATPADLLEEFRLKGWKAPGYHMVVDHAGRATSLLPLERVANGVKGWNKNAIHIAWIGGADGKDSRTEEQKRKLRIFVKCLQLEYPKAIVMGHRDIWGEDPREWQKTCPNFNVKEEYNF